MRAIILDLAQKSYRKGVIDVEENSSGTIWGLREEGSEPVAVRNSANWKIYEKNFREEPLAHLFTSW